MTMTTETPNAQTVKKTLTILRPGIMIAVKSTVTGGVSYDRKELDADAEKESEAQAREGAEVRRWETTKRVQDADEHERATKTRGKALALIRKVAANTAFGLLCPEANEPALDAAIAEARALVADHNANANHTRVYITTFKARIASTDEEAARAIGEEVRLLMDAMSAGIDKLDAEAIREAATKAKELETMLAPIEAEKVSNAVAQARKAARDIVRRINKEGEAAAIVLADIQRGAIEKARIAFLDLDEDVPNILAAGDAVDPERIAGLDLDDATASGVEISGEPGEV